MHMDVCRTYAGALGILLGRMHIVYVGHMQNFSWCALVHYIEYVSYVGEVLNRG